MKLIICFAFLLTSSTFCISQVIPICGSDQSTVNIEEYYYNSVFENQLVQQKSYGGIEWVPIQIHMVLRNDGTGYNPLDSLQWEIDTLNARFGRGNIQFFQCAPVKYIKSTTLYNSRYDSYNTHKCGGYTPEYILGSYSVPNVVNIYLIDSSNTSHAHFPSDRTSKCADWIILNKAQLKWYGVLAHEMGHYLNLFHTFNGERLAANREHITRNSADGCYNCLTVGDLLCDTEADPDTSSSGSWNNACNFTMTTRDTGCLDQKFTPWNENIMSYSDCTHFFTQGQITRMTAALLNSSRNYLKCDALEDCQPQLTLLGNGTYTNKYFQTSNYIYSTQNNISYNYLAYDAKNLITLSPGFQATAYLGNVFSAYIEGCYGDRIYERGQSIDTTLRIYIAATKYNIMSSIYCNLPPEELYYLKVLKNDGTLIYKSSFRNINKDKPIDFYHNPITEGIQKVILYYQPLI